MPDNNNPSPSPHQAWPSAAQVLHPGTDVDKPASQAANAAHTNHAGDMFDLIKKHGVKFAMLLTVWGLGYFRFSWSWLFLGTIVMVWRERNNQSKHLTMELARRATQNERQTILSAVNNLPSWVYFPDTERAEWLNKMIKQLWPYIEGYVVNILRDTVEPAVLKALPKYLKSFKFENISLGTNPPRIGGVKVYTDKVGRDEIILDLEIFYAGNADIEVSLKALRRFKAGIEKLQLHGTLRVEMKPLVDKVPLIGGMSIYFLNKPAIDFNMTNLADVLDIPGLCGILRTILEDQLANFLVLPNRLPVKLIDDVDISSLKYPMPQGVLSITIIEAKNLVAADVGLLKRGKSDPYCIIRVGSQTFKTKTMKRTLNPIWNKQFEAIVYSCHGQTLDVDVWDRDEGLTKDDYLGTVSLNLRHVADAGHLDAWLGLQEIKQGDIHIALTWLTLTDSISAIYEREEELQDSHDDEMDEERVVINTKEAEDSNGEDDSTQSAAILMVKLDSAKDLPVSNRSSSLPQSYVNMTVGRVSKTSQVTAESCSPIWEEVFNFLIESPSLQNLKVEVMDKKKDRCIGILVLPIKRLLVAPNLVLEQPFRLDGSGPQSVIVLKMCLRGLQRTKSRKVLNPRAVLLSEMSLEVEAEIGRPLEDEMDLKPQRQSSVFEESPKHEPLAPEAPAVIGIIPEVVDNVSMSASVDESPQINETELRRRLTEHSRETEEAAFGKVQVTLRYSAQRSRLIVVVHKAEKIRRRGSSEAPDTYVRMYLLPDKSKSGKRKTKEVKDSYVPVYDETLEYTVGIEEIPTRTLQLVVKDSSRFISLSDPIIGQTEIDLSKLDLNKAVTQWYTLKLPEPE